MKELGAAIVGCGSIFPLHAKALSELDGVRLRAVVDTDAERARLAGEEYECEALSDYQALLGNPDIQVVHLCTPHHLHVPMALSLLKAGKHVLTEKPISHTLSEGKELAAAAAMSGKQLGVCFQNRYNEASLRIKETILSGELGKLIGMKAIVTWYRDEAYYKQSPWRGKWATEGGGVLMNQSIHTLDLLQWFGGDISSVRGSVTTDSLDGVIEVEDTAHARIRFTNGATALFYATNGYVDNSPVELEILFEGGKLIQRSDSLYQVKGAAEDVLCGAAALTGPPGKSYWGSSHASLIQDFYACLQKGEAFAIDGREGLKAVKLADDIYRSSGVERSVKLRT
ncbi:oxidoreductase [Paenibacillus yonginensis]|uniref:Oxidoreductase n=1 Tax=Paenibacillus yonginensis TaxID=1462996 RepID=A0A1B1MZ36_9BACL|nr:Gfo/Idh/MocA family oxidoreductase [Paenibacillus yonginensis]ANS74442.1 oxidoreductase [Paenibacillus yonginensis]